MAIGGGDCDCHWLNLLNQFIKKICSFIHLVYLFCSFFFFFQWVELNQVTNKICLICLVTFYSIFFFFFACYEWLIKPFFHLDSEMNHLNRFTNTICLLICLVTCLVLQVYELVIKWIIGIYWATPIVLISFSKRFIHLVTFSVGSCVFMSQINHSLNFI